MWYFCYLSGTLHPFKSLCRDLSAKTGVSVRTLLTLQPAPGLWHFWLHVEVNYVSTLWQKLYLNCGTGTAAKAALLWPHGLPQTPPFQTDEWMHRPSCLPKCPRFPHSPVNVPRETASLTIQHMTLKPQQSWKLLWAEYISLLHPIAILLAIWKLSHFCGWLNHLIRFWGFALDEDVHWDLFIKWTEKSRSHPQDLGSLHRKPHSLLPSHQGQPYSWSFTCLFSYLKGGSHLGL